MPNPDDKLKYPEGRPTEPLLIEKMGFEELPYGRKYVIYIKQTIEGYDHFMPSDGLINKLKEENVDIGDKITIEKVPPSDKYQYGYFTVKVVEKGNGPQIAQDRIEKSPVGAGFTQKDEKHKSVEKFEKQFEEPKDDKMGLHELTVRVEKLETIVATLWTDYTNRTSDAGHKVGDEKLPF